MMREIKYKKYSKWKMSKIIRTMPILFVETSLNGAYVIRKKDLADFIILEANRTGHHIEMEFYMPGIDEPVATTFGWFLNTINPLLREEIIERLVALQTGEKRPKKIKIFDIDKSSSLRKIDIAIDRCSDKDFDKCYEQYVKAQNTYNIKMEGV